GLASCIRSCSRTGGRTTKQSLDSTEPSVCRAGRHRSAWRQRSHRRGYAAMKSRLIYGAILLLTVLVFGGCSRLSGKPGPDAEVPRPDQVLDANVLFSQNCAGCHGIEGQHGPALDLSNPVYLALVDDDTLRTTIS